MLFPGRVGVHSCSFYRVNIAGDPGENSQSKDENERQSQPTWEVRFKNRTQATSVEDDRSPHCLSDRQIGGHNGWKMILALIIWCNKGQTVLEE